VLPSASRLLENDCLDTEKLFPEGKVTRPGEGLNWDDQVGSRSQALSLVVKDQAGCPQQ
jgi:hypothetical protein